MSLVAYGSVAPWRFEAKSRTNDSSNTSNSPVEQDPNITYVLQGPEYVNDGIDWSRNLPVIPSLTRGAHDK